MNLEQNIVQVHIEDIIPNRFQPRLNFDEEGLKELSDSIKEHGIIQPLVLRKLGDKYEIIAGERRYKAATMAGLTTVPAVVSNIDDNKAAEVAIVENVQRRNLTAIEEARSYKNLLDKGYLTQEGLAKKMGLSQSAISNKLRLLNLDDEVQQALLDEKISERHARTLLSIPDKEAQKEWLHRIINERLTVRQLDLELKKSHTKLDDSIKQDEEIGVPLVSSKPSIEDIKANAMDIHDTSNKMSVEDMMKPTEIINEEIETLDMDEPKKEENNNENGFVDFSSNIKEEKNIIETPKSIENNTFDTELVQNNNDSKFFNFAPEEDRYEEKKDTQLENTFINPEGNNNGFEIIDEVGRDNNEFKDMSLLESSQENPFTAADSPNRTEKNENTFFNSEPENNNDPTGFGDGISISTNNKFFKPTIEENNNMMIQEQIQEIDNPMDRVSNLENDDGLMISNETMTLKDTINEIRKTIEKIGNRGVYAEVEELDFEDSYQINIKIPKDN